MAALEAVVFAAAGFLFLVVLGFASSAFSSAATLVSSFFGSVSAAFAAVLNLLYLLPYSITSLANSIYSPALLLLFLNSTTGALLSWDHSMELSTRMKVSKR